MLTDILQMLIDNAIKFTENGSIKIAARHSQKSKTVQFTVADTGEGIPKESLPVIFELFRQADSSETRLYSGVGLGLYIVKKYTELLKGKIKVRSKMGKGSVFTIAIPC
jgi:signal transduction histidine kinase